VTDPTDDLSIARQYLAAIERGATGDELAAYFAPDALQEEFPNRLTPHGARRGLNEILEAAVRGQQVTTSQRYRVLSSIASGDRVALEVAWSANLAIPLGTIPAGGEMHARFAVFLEFRDGTIVRQRSYDCFEPF
jgi:ketosteroid isomerase-like protein